MKNKIVFDNGYMQLIDENLKDAFNRKIYVAVDFDSNFIGLRYILSEKEQEQKRKQYYANCKIIIMQKVIECIDITKATYNKIIKLGYYVPIHYINEKWNALY